MVHGGRLIGPRATRINMRIVCYFQDLSNNRLSLAAIRAQTYGCTATAPKHRGRWTSRQFPSRTVK
jgi:hypothetical protein